MSFLSLVYNDIDQAVLDRLNFVTSTTFFKKTSVGRLTSPFGFDIDSFVEQTYNKLTEKNIENSFKYPLFRKFHRIVAIDPEQMGLFDMVQSSATKIPSNQNIEGFPNQNKTLEIALEKIKNETDQFELNYDYQKLLQSRGKQTKDKTLFYTIEAINDMHNQLRARGMIKKSSASTTKEQKILDLLEAYKNDRKNQPTAKKQSKSSVAVVDDDDQTVDNPYLFDFDRMKKMSKEENSSESESEVDSDTERKNKKKEKKSKIKVVVRKKKKEVSSSESEVDSDTGSDSDSD